MSNNDHLSNEISVSARIENKSLTAGAKSRAISAADRLIGNLLDIPSAYLEAFSKSIRARGNIEEKKVLDSYRSASDPNAQDGLTGKLIDSHNVHTNLKKIENKRAVVEFAIENFGDDGQSNNIDGDIEEDWLNYFEFYAEKASSERMQELWGRILSGEIREPGEFSLSTLQFISELDKEIAEKFEKAVSVRSSEGYILKPDKLENEELLDLIFLEEVGLLQEVNGLLQRSVQPQEGGKFYLREGDLLLVGECDKILKIPIIRITRVGREIIKIFPEQDQMKFLEEAVNKFEKDVKSVDIAHIFSEEPGGNISFRSIKKLK